MMRTASPRRRGLRYDMPAPPPIGSRLGGDRTVILPGILLGALLAGGAGCGAVGDPIAPEDIGIEAKVRAQRQAEALRAAPEGQQTTPDEEPEIVLPPLQPIGAQ